MSYITRLLSIAVLGGVSVFILGCNNPSDPEPVTPEANDTPPVETELILPADSEGEGSEPKNSGPFGGAAQPDEKPEK